MSSAGFILDLGRCIGCGACVIACRLTNGLPDGVSWRRVLPLNLDRLGGGPTYHLSLACHHCDRPACVAACPAGAFSKRRDGAVTLDREACIGCRYCEMACPFGAPRYDAAARVMSKCDLCIDRVDRGFKPACVVACPTEALSFDRGDAEAPRRNSVPGFSDPAGCVPRLTFLSPRGARRALLYERLHEVLNK